MSFIMWWECLSTVCSCTLIQRYSSDQSRKLECRVLHGSNFRKPSLTHLSVRKTVPDPLPDLFPMIKETVYRHNQFNVLTLY